MISKLRIKLILAAMISLLVVLTAVMGGVALVNYRKIVSDADNTLNLLAENEGHFPVEQVSDLVSPENEAPRQKHFPGRKTQPFPPELPFETRYFFVILDEGGSVSDVNTGKIAAVDDENAEEYALAAYQSGSVKGFMDDYRYLLSPSGEQTLILFLDCGRKLESFRTLILSSLLVSAAGALLVLLLLILLSGKIVKPFLENYEKEKRFITDAGHELKTPLTIIDADTEILSMDYGENEWISDIRTQTQRLSNLTNDLILLSRMEETARPVQMLDFPLSDVVEETVQSFQTVATTQRKHLSTQIEPMLTLCGDEKSIRKLITILLDNALKYTESEGNIRCALGQKKSCVQLIVYNTTAQMTREQTGHLFERFYRTDRSRNSETGGYGLGLSIAQAIVTAHKGKISADTQDEHSLTITVTLPA